MKNQATEIVRDTRSEAADDVKSRRTKFILTHLFIFLACLLASLFIWLVVHYAKSGEVPPATAELGDGVTLSCNHLI